MEILRQLSLFTGYGGFELGLRLAGVDFRTVGYVEIDEYCQQVIQNRIRDGRLDWAPIIRDVRTADFRPLAGLVDLITAGFPCQPHSVAGRRAGAADRRNLWPDTLRALRETRPRYVLLENAGVHLRNGGQPAYAYTVHSIAEWRDIRTKYPGIYSEALDLERALKEMKRGPFYLYKGKYGLGLQEAMRRADLQGELWPEADQFQNECEGHCGL